MKALIKINLTLIDSIQEEQKQKQKLLEKSDPLFAMY